MPRKADLDWDDLRHFLRARPKPSAAQSPDIMELFGEMGRLHAELKAKAASGEHAH